MSVKKGLNGATLIAVLVIAIGAGYLIATGGHFGTASIGQAQVQQQGNSCLSGVAPTISLTAFTSNLTSGGAPVQQAVSYKLYNIGSQTPSTSGTSSSTASTSISNVNCGSSYNLILGDNSNEYVYSVPVAIQNSVVTVQANATKIASPTIAVTNATSNAFGTSTKLVSASSGIIYTNLQVQISGGAGFFGYPNYAIEYVSNSTEVTSVGQVGYSSVSTGALPLPSSFTNPTKEWAYQMPQLAPYQKVIVNPQVQIGTFSSNALVGIYLISQANYNNLGTLEAGQYVNPITSSALVSTVSDTSAVTIV